MCSDQGAPIQGPTDDVAEVTAAQVRRLVKDLIGMGRWKAGDRP